MTADGSSELPSAAPAPRGSRPRSPRARLLAHDVHLVPTRSAAGPIAVASCERLGRVLPLEQCKACPRFVRIELDETRCILLCHSTDEVPCEVP
jgi:hypothetical protein